MSKDEFFSACSACPVLKLSTILVITLIIFSFGEKIYSVVKELIK